MTERKESIKQQAQILLSRLERISVDSVWAHKASGIRGSIIRKLNEQDPKNPEQNLKDLEELVARGYVILIHAASKIPDIENDNSKIN